MMIRDPEFVPLQPGVFALKNERRKVVYVSWTQNLQKRSHSMSHMLLQYDKWLASTKPGPRGGAVRPKTMPYWPIRDLPKHPSSEFVFKVEWSAVTHLPTHALQEVNRVQKKYQKLGYAIVTGHRATTGLVRVYGRRMKLSDAVRECSDEDYLTVYRRLQRGWTVEQSLGLEPPSPRWHKVKQKMRKAREKEWYEARAA